MKKIKLATVLFVLLSPVLWGDSGDVIDENSNDPMGPVATVSGDLVVKDDTSDGFANGNLEVEGYSNLVGDLTIQGADIKVLHVIAGAWGSGRTHRRIFYDGQDYSATDSGPSRGLSILRINRLDGTVTSHIGYDTFLNTATAVSEIIAALSQMTENDLVVITSSDAWKGDSNLVAAMEGVGGSSEIKTQTNVNKARRSYVLIGVPGIGYGNGIELYNEVSESAPAAEIAVLLVKGGDSTLKYTPIGLNGSDNMKNSGNAFFSKKVGIGTETPEADLHIAGDLKVEGFITSTDTGLNLNDKILFSTEAPTEGGVISIVDAGQGQDGVRLLSFSEGSDPSIADEFLFRGNFAGSGGAGNSITFGSGIPGSGWEPNIMTWQGDGKVGIGTTAPTAKLHVSWDHGNIMTIENPSANDGFSGGDMLRIRNAGVKTNNRYIEFTADHDGDEGGSVEFGAIKYGANDALNITNPSGNAITLSSSTGVGIGTTTPAAQLHVVGDTQVDGQMRMKTEWVSGGGSMRFTNLMRALSASGISLQDNAPYWLTVEDALHPHNYSGVPERFIIEVTGSKVGEFKRDTYYVKSRGGLEVYRKSENGGISTVAIGIHADPSVPDGNNDSERYHVVLHCDAGSAYQSLAVNVRDLNKGTWIPIAYSLTDPTVNWTDRTPNIKWTSQKTGSLNVNGNINVAAGTIILEQPTGDIPMGDFN